MIKISRRATRHRLFTAIPVAALAVVLAACGSSASSSSSSTTAAATSSAASSKQAISYPTRPVHIIVPTAAGSATDLQARSIASCLQQNLKQPFVVEDKPGGSGATGLLALKSSSPDGYTLGASVSQQVVVNPILHPTIGYSAKDFIPLALESESPVVMVASSNSKYTNASAVFSAAKTGKIPVATPLSGSLGAIVVDALVSHYGLHLSEVPFTGNGQIVKSLLGGKYAAAFLPYDNQVLAPNVAAGKIKVLATATSSSLSYLPKVPTLASLGYTQLPPGNVLFYFVAPKGIPSSVQTVLVDNMKSCLQTPSIVKTIGKNLMPSTFVGPSGLQTMINSNVTYYSKLAK